MLLKSSLLSRAFLCVTVLATSVMASAQNSTSTISRDYIVAVVDSTPITNHDVNARVPTLRDQLKQQGRPIPPDAALLQVALERLIVEKALLQHAKEAGVSVEDEALDQAEQRMAAQNQISVAALHKKLKSEGTSVERFRQNLRDQLVLQRLTDRNIPSRIKISDVEIIKSYAFANLQQKTQTPPLNWVTC